jgi:methylated-DNA-protein-cysteine methyltransferase-like protein
VTERDERIVAVLRSLGAGEVVTYGDVAADAGFPRHARLVGRILAAAYEELSWWRVVGAGGRLVPGNEREHAARLRAEGVVVDGGKVRTAPAGRFGSR